MLESQSISDRNDCGNCETLFEYWPDRLLGNIIYDGKFYAGTCEQMDDYNFNIDLVNCKMESLV